MGLRNLEVVLDSSEYYDYELGENTMDYIYIEIITAITYYLLTENDLIITTENNERLIYI
jgi:hypothetical protein